MLKEPKKKRPFDWYKLRDILMYVLTVGLLLSSPIAIFFDYLYLALGMIISSLVIAFIYGHFNPGWWDWNEEKKGY